MLSKVLETILLNRLEKYLLTNDNEWIKEKHGTDMGHVTFMRLKR